MSKRAKKSSPASSNAAAFTVGRSMLPTRDQQSNLSDRPSKKSRVVAMLRSKNGTTIDAMMKTTGWQQHSVRGFLAGVVRKRLKLKLSSKIVNGSRVYRVAGTPGLKSGDRQAKKH